MKISVLASSSSGNASVIAAGDTVILVDAGISALRIRRGLEAGGLSAAAVQGIFITHEHTDHISGLGVFCSKCTAPIYCSRYLRNELRLKTKSPFTFIEPGAPVQVGCITVTPFAVSHDALDPMGYIFEHDGVRLGYVTDSGQITRSMEAILQGVDALYLESNYDKAMLHASGRPWNLIQRIEGRWGHLSNEQAADLVRRIAHPGLQHVILAHLSSECNTPECAGAHMQSTLEELQLNTRLHTARKAETLPWVQISAFPEKQLKECLL